MPYKAGPNNTLRSYSSKNGRYVKETPDSLLEKLQNTKPLSKEMEKAIKKKYRLENIRNRALKSKDPLLAEVYMHLESIFPNQITHVNDMIYFPQTERCHECDIVIRNCIIEVKSGTRGAFLKQYNNLKNYCQTHNKKAILYAPNIPKRSLAQQKANNICIASNYKELEELIKQ